MIIDEIIKISYNYYFNYNGILLIYQHYYDDFEYEDGTLNTIIVHSNGNVYTSTNIPFLYEIEHSFSTDHESDHESDHASDENQLNESIDSLTLNNMNNINDIWIEDIKQFLNKDNLNQDIMLSSKNVLKLISILVNIQIWLKSLENGGNDIALKHGYNIKVYVDKNEKNIKN